MRNLNKFIRNKNITVIYVSLALIFVGCFLFVYQSFFGLRDMTERRINMAISLIDNIFDGSYMALTKAGPLLNEPCDQSMPIMLNIINTVSGLQSFNIENDDNIIVCSTSGLLTGLKFNLDYLSESDFLMKRSKILTPGYPLIVLKRKINNKTIFVTISGSNLYTLLDVIKNVDNFVMETKNFYLDSKGNLLPNDGRYNMTKSSNENEFKISVRIGFNDYVSYGIRENLFLLVIFTLLATIYAAHSFIKTLSPLSIHQIKKALINNQFLPYVQPIVNAQGELAGLEVLLRWTKPHGMIYPDVFIPTAEATGAIIPITEKLMDDVAIQLSPFSSNLPKSFHIGINISAKHFDIDHQDSLIQCCNKFRNTPIGIQSELLLEITERELIKDYEQVNKTISTLHALGVKLAIDDFGTGHSTLDYIKNLSVDTIKIDKSFIDLIEKKAITAQLVDNIIDLSKRLNVSIIAEGVETALQATYLVERGVDYLQGYYFSKPMPIDEFIKEYIPVIIEDA